MPFGRRHAVGGVPGRQVYAQLSHELMVRPSVHSQLIGFGCIGKVDSITTRDVTHCRPSEFLVGYQ